MTAPDWQDEPEDLDGGEPEPPASWLEDDGEDYNSEGVVLYLVGSLIFWAILFIVWIIWISSGQ